MEVSARGSITHEKSVAFTPIDNGPPCGLSAWWRPGRRDGGAARSEPPMRACGLLLAALACVRALSKRSDVLLTMPNILFQCVIDPFAHASLHPIRDSQILILIITSPILSLRTIIPQFACWKPSKRRQVSKWGIHLQNGKKSSAATDRAAKSIVLI
jgi:hypothetical protein